MVKSILNLCARDIFLRLRLEKIIIKSVIKILINGETKEITGGLNLSKLLEVLALPSERIAIELNREVVRKKDWENIFIKDADKIEIVHFVGGG